MTPEAHAEDKHTVQSFWKSFLHWRQEDEWFSGFTAWLPTFVTCIKDLTTSSPNPASPAATGTHLLNFLPTWETQTHPISPKSLQNLKGAQKVLFHNHNWRLLYHTLWHLKVLFILWERRNGHRGIKAKIRGDLWQLWLTQHPWKNLQES